MKEKKQRRKYDAEFKAEVLKMMSNGQSARDISQKLDVGEESDLSVESAAKGKFRG